MSTTLRLASDELVTLAAGGIKHGVRLTQLQVYGRNPRRRSQPGNLYEAVDAVIMLRPEELARLVIELLRRLSVAGLDQRVREELEAEVRRLGFAE